MSATRIQMDAPEHTKKNKSGQAAAGVPLRLLSCARRTSISRQRLVFDWGPCFLDAHACRPGFASPLFSSWA